MKNIERGLREPEEEIPQQENSVEMSLPDINLKIKELEGQKKSIEEEIEGLYQQKKEMLKSLPQKKFGPKQWVWAKRSSGDVEFGWQVFGYDGEKVVIKKEEAGGKILEKRVSEDELKKIQEEEREKLSAA